jgi:altronate hydrolase
MLRTLANYAGHPNVAAVIFLDLGCEKTNLSLVGRYLKDHGGLQWEKPVAWLGIQECGGTEAAVKRGLEEVGRMLDLANRAERIACPASELVLGVKCGGSDGFSGLSANPALGHCSDLLVRSGGAMITEVPEFCGAEHVFAGRACDASVASRGLETVDWYKRSMRRSSARCSARIPVPETRPVDSGTSRSSRSARCRSAARRA